MTNYAETFRAELDAVRLTAGVSIPHLLVAMEHAFFQQVRMVSSRGDLQHIPTIIAAFDEVWAEVVKAHAA